MRVLSIAYTNYTTDPRVIRASEAVARRGDEIEILTLRRAGDSPSELINGVTVHHLPIERYRGSSASAYMLHYLRFFVYVLVVATLKQLKKPYQAVHVHNMPEFLVFAALAPKLSGAKIVLDIHDLMPETFASKFASGSILLKIIKGVEKASFRFADYIITVHDPYAERIQERGVPAEKLTVVMNLPDPAIFYPRSFKRDSRFTLIYHGIVARRQGLDFMVRALTELKKENILVRFLLIGEGDALDEIMQLAEELDVQELLDFRAFMPADQIPELIVTAHVGVIPYRAETATHQMLPVKLLEYAVMGIPVITSRLDVVSKYFDESMLYFIPPEDVQALSRGIRLLYNDRALWEHYGERIQSFNEKYNWPKESQKLISIYDRIELETS